MAGGRPLTGGTVLGAAPFEVHRGCGFSFGLLISDDCRLIFLSEPEFSGRSGQTGRSLMAQPESQALDPAASSRHVPRLPPDLPHDSVC